MACSRFRFQTLTKPLTNSCRCLTAALSPPCRKAFQNYSDSLPKGFPRHPAALPLACRKGCNRFSAKDLSLTTYCLGVLKRQIPEKGLREAKTKRLAPVLAKRKRSMR